MVKCSKFDEKANTCVARHIPFYHSSSPESSFLAKGKNRNARANGVVVGGGPKLRQSGRAKDGLQILWKFNHPYLPPPARMKAKERVNGRNER